jgi:hypothetical protein
MTSHKAAFGRHKAPTKDIHWNRNKLGRPHHFQPAKGDPQTSTGLLHTSGPSGRLAETTVDPLGPPTSTEFNEIENALPRLAGAWTYHRPR